MAKRNLSCPGPCLLLQPHLLNHPQVLKTLSYLYSKLPCSFTTLGSAAVSSWNALPSALHLTINIIASRLTASVKCSLVLVAALCYYSSLPVALSHFLSPELFLLSPYTLTHSSKLLFGILPPFSGN